MIEAQLYVLNSVRLTNYFSQECNATSLRPSDPMTRWRGSVTNSADEYACWETTSSVARLRRRAVDDSLEGSEAYRHLRENGPNAGQRTRLSSRNIAKCGASWDRRLLSDVILL